jgi:hypothetical protein
MIELLVLLSCANSTGCAETSSAYFHYKPEVKRSLERLEYRAKHAVGEKVYTYSNTIALIAARREFTIKVTDRMSVKGDPGWEKLSLYYSYPF